MQDHANETLIEACKGRIKALALTGIRSEYDLFYPLLKILQADKAFELGVVVCGAHLTSLHDYSVRQIEKDGFRIAEKLETLLYSSSALGKTKSAGILLMGLAQVLEREKPDLLLVIGDREEAIIGALAGGYMCVPVVHLAGGDHTHPEGGDVDEEVRHATTKLSHIHLTMAEEHSQRIQRLGEEKWRIFTVGSGGIDRLRADEGMSRTELSEILGPTILKDYMVLIYHPLSSEIGQAGKQMKTILDACINSGMDVFIGAPNSDPGFQDIERVINEYSVQPAVHLYRNLPRRTFASLLKHAACLLGNSSLALHEASFLGLPSINIGQRQRQRLAGDNVQFIEVDPDQILLAIKEAINPKYRENLSKGCSPYGDGHMAERTVQILKTLPSREKLLAKMITY
ncbi:UDP-N-acetylglucosamine 2-epimerase [Anaeroarcus burkinensis]|uniref:UDP-N-acetylglucosamine 2-epimerase n=1 Tax=Anaeroarcus burkinensis TaxID=82376 RepID=UPI0004186D39|nr:UDP-N-acetylglucosamine 2-epimerase [Anaeroarcus burkinensis]